MATEPRPGGFDVVLGNPPWERVKLQEQEFFSIRDPAIAGAPNAAARKRAIAALKDNNPPLLQEFREASRKAEGESHLLRSSGRFPLCGRGDINTYAVFAESGRDAISPIGRLGIIVPSGIATDDTTKFFFGDLVETQTLAELLSFENEEFIFPGVHHSYCFSLMVVSGRSAPVAEMEFVFFARRITQLDPTEGRRFRLTAEDIRLLNPNTLTCPVFRSERDAEITKAIYRRVPVLIREARDGHPESNPWGITFRAMFHMASDSELFVEPEVACPAVARALAADPNATPPYLPLYEAKMLHQFDHRWATYAPTGAGWLDASINTRVNPRGEVVPDARDMTSEEHDDPTAQLAPRYWVPEDAVGERLVKYKRDSETGEQVVVWHWDEEWLLSFRNVSRANNDRTMIATIIPRSAVGHSAPLMFLNPASASRAACLLAAIGSFSCDYVARQKVGGINMTFGYVCQFAVPPAASITAQCQWDRQNRLAEWLTPRVLELVYTADDLSRFARDLGYDGPPFRWNEARRARIRAELDAAFFHLYGISRDDVDYIMDTFTVFKARDEQRNGGVYKTKEMILSIYDEMSEAMATGNPWVSSLDPPPGDPRAALTPESMASPRGHQAVAVVIPRTEIDIDRLLVAFRSVRDGMSPDYVVAEPAMNERFQAAAREAGLRASPELLNKALLNLRKAGGLKDEDRSRQYRLRREFDLYTFASEWSVRHLQRELLREINRMPALDELLCNPAWAARLDEIAARIKPGFEPIDYRWAALSIRKRGRSKPEPETLELPMHRQLSLEEWLTPDIPAGAGLYLIFANDKPLYVNWTRDLAEQIARHREVGGEEMTPHWLLNGVGRANRLTVASYPLRDPDQLQEMRIAQVATLAPWLNLLDLGDVA